MGILTGMRVVEGSAFVAIPLAGMTLAQMGAEVIRFDRIEGGLDAARWPVTAEGRSLFWAGLNKGKKSVAVDLQSPEGREIVTQIVTAPGPDAGLFLTNLRVRGWMDYPTLSALRPDLVMVTLLGDRHGRPQVDYTVNPAVGFPDATGPEGATTPTAHVLPAWDCIAGNMAVTALLAAERHRLRTGAGQEVVFSLKDAAAAMLGNLGIIGEVAVNGVGPPEVRQRALRRLRAGLPLRRRAARDGHRAHGPPVGGAREGHRHGRGDGRARGAARREPHRRGRPLPPPRGDHGGARAVLRRAPASTTSRPPSTRRASPGPNSAASPARCARTPTSAPRTRCSPTSTSRASAASPSRARPSPSARSRARPR